MKVGLVLDDTLDTPDGVQQYVLTLGDWLVKHGHEVRYLVGATKRTDISHVQSLSRNIKVKFNGNRMSMPLPASRERLRNLLAHEQFDVIHVQVPYSPFMAGRLLRLTPARTAIIGTFHILPYGRVERTANRLLALINRRTSKRFSRMIAASQPAADFAKVCYGFDATVIPHPFDYKRFAVVPSTESGTNVIYMARLVERKGAQWLVRAVAAMAQRKTLPNDTRVRIGGKGPLLNQLQAEVAKHRLGHIISFDGFIPEAKKAAYLSQADIALFPSTAGESFGISVIEAMAAARGVVLAGDNPGYRSALPIAKQLIDPTDTGMFADQLAYWLERSSERNDAAKTQRKIAAGYDQDIVCAKVLRIYDQALQTHRQA